MNGPSGERPLRDGAEPVEDVTLATVAARPGRLPPAAWYPRGDGRVRALFVRLRDGERVRVLTCGDPDAAPVLLLHGWACSAFSWRNQLPVLADAGFHAVAVDLRGHGLSDQPADASRYTTPQMDEFVELLLDALAIDRAAVVGHSLGGGLALHLALTVPSRVSRVAVVSGVGLGSIPLIRLLALLPDALVRAVVPWIAPRWLYALVLHFVTGRRGRYPARDVDEYWAATQWPGHLRALWSLIRRYDWRPLERIAAGDGPSQPVLAIYGGQDRLLRRLVGVAPAEAALSVAGGAAGAADAAGPGGTSAAVAACSRAVVLDGIGHVAHEEWPERVNELLLPFLAPWREEGSAQPGVPPR